MSRSMPPRGTLNRIITTHHFRYTGSGTTHGKTAIGGREIVWPVLICNLAGLPLLAIPLRKSEKSKQNGDRGNIKRRRWAK